MRNALICLLLIATLLPVVSPWGTIAYYHANKDYIARVLCENRDKPQLHCDGQCYLAKRLKAQQDKQDKETNERVQHSPVFQLYCQEYPAFTFTLRTAIHCESCAFTYLLVPYSAPLFPIFQPPAMGC